MNFISTFFAEQPLLRMLLPELSAEPSTPRHSPRVLYLKGSNRVMEQWWGSKAHKGFQTWLAARSAHYTKVVWDGDPIRQTNFTHFLRTDAQRFLPHAKLQCMRLSREVTDSFLRDIKALDADIDVLQDDDIRQDDPDRPAGICDTQWEYIKLGAAGMKLHGPGDVVVLGGGTVPLNEIAFTAHSLPSSFNWFCFRVNGFSEICKAYEEKSGTAAGSQFESWYTVTRIGPCDWATSPSTLSGYSFLAKKQPTPWQSLYAKPSLTMNAIKNAENQKADFFDAYKPFDINDIDFEGTNVVLPSPRDVFVDMTTERQIAANVDVRVDRGEQNAQMHRLSPELSLDSVAGTQSPSTEYDDDDDDDDTSSECSDYTSVSGSSDEF